MKNLLLILFFTSCNLFYAQIPIGEDVIKGKNELKLLMSKNGFTLIKDRKASFYTKNNVSGKFDIPITPHYEILFKQEVKIHIFYNEFDNISKISIYPKNFDQKKKIFKILHSSKWAVLQDRSSFMGVTNYFTYNGFLISSPADEKGRTIQIHFYSEKPDLSK